MNKTKKISRFVNYFFSKKDTGTLSGVISRKVGGDFKPIAVARLDNNKVKFYKIDVKCIPERTEKGLREPVYIETSCETSIKPGDMLDRGDGVLKIP